MSDARSLYNGSPCPACGAMNRGYVTRCWLCQAELERSPTSGGRTADDAFIQATLVGDADFPPTSDVVRRGGSTSNSYTLSSLLLLMTLAAAVFALYRVYPGMAIMLGVILVPVFFRTVLVVRKRKQRGLPVTAHDKAFLFVGSFFTAISAIILTSLAMIVSLIGACFVAIGTNTTGPAMANFQRNVLIAFVPTVVLLGIFFGWWVRQRWRRDTGAN